jgi:hypothetical protein
MALPTKAETIAVIPGSLGITATTLTDGAFTVIQGAALEQIGAFLDCSPVVAADTATVRHFDGFYPSSSGHLLLMGSSMIPRGLTAIIKTNWTVDDGVIPGSWLGTLTVDEDYTFKGNNVGPVHSIRFNSSPGGGSKAIAISARWGFCTSEAIPYALFMAIMLYTGAIAVTGQGADIGPVKREKAGPVEREYTDAGTWAGSMIERANSLLAGLVVR